MPDADNLDGDHRRKLMRNFGEAPIQFGKKPGWNVMRVGQVAQAR